MPFYNSYKRAVFDGGIDLVNNTIKCALFPGTYSQNIDTEDFWDDISSQELAAGGGYTAGGEALTTKSTSQDNVDDEGVFDADPVVWTAATFTARVYVLWKDTGTPTTSNLITAVNMGSDQSPSAANFTINWNAEGIFNSN